jgi:hypothetical protein
MIYTKEEITFSTLEDFYQKAEQVNAHSTTAISWRIKELIENVSNVSEKKWLAWEMEAFHFVLADGKAGGYIKSPEKDGVSEYEYPNPAELSQDALQYYYTRSSATVNNSLKLRYLQIIVSANDKKLAGLSFKPLIDCCICEIEMICKSEVKKENAHDTRVLLKSCFILSKKAKYRLEAVAGLCYNLFFGKYPDSAKYRLLELIVAYKNAYTETQLHTVYQEALRLSQTSPYNTDCFAMERLAPAAIKLAQILRQPFKTWYEKSGATYEAEMLKRTDDTSKMMPMHWCEKAIAQYQLAGNTEKEKSLHVKYAELRKEFTLDTYSHELDRNAMTDWYNELDRKAKYLVKSNEIEVLLNYLSGGNDIFPNITWLKENADKKDKSFLDTISISKADTNKNFSKKIISDEDHNWNSIFETYDYYINFHALPLLRRIFVYGFTSRKISHKTIMLFLQQNSWMGCTLVSKDSGGNEIRYNWLSLIAPALHNFFLEFETLLFSESNRINLVLSVDSLVLKFEGLLRDFARLLAVPTTVLAKGNMREMYIDELLELDEIKTYFDENDMLLFRYIFVSKNGMNLRNNIAHAFLHFGQYSIEQMVLMIMALLRLAKYTVDTSKQTI